VESRHRFGKGGGVVDDLVGDLTASEIDPAEAALPPDGVTYTTTGTWAPKKAWTISRIDSSSPPGVSNSTTKTLYPSSSAVRIPSARYPAVTGVMGPSTVATSAVGASWAMTARPNGARSAVMNRAANVRRRGTRRRKPAPGLPDVDSRWPMR
jgi:hypothetical protein